MVRNRSEPNQSKSCHGQPDNIRDRIDPGDKDGLGDHPNLPTNIILQTPATPNSKLHAVRVGLLLNITYHYVELVDDASKCIKFLQGLVLVS